MLTTELAVTRGRTNLVHRRFPRALRTVCGYRVAGTLFAAGGRTPCPSCAKFLA